MKEIVATTTIKGEPEAIWAALIDAPKYPEWDTGVDRIEGHIGPGETIKVFSKISPGRAFPVKVSEFTPGKKMVWSGGMPMGLFKGERTFSLAPIDPGTTRFTMREEFSGPLLPLIWRSMPDLEPTFRQFTLDLKRRVEGAG